MLNEIQTLEISSKCKLRMIRNLDGHEGWNIELFWIMW